MVSVSGKPWGPVREVNSSDIPTKARRAARGQWDDLGDELILRLERTPRSCALEIPFENERQAHCAYLALYKYFMKYLGKGAVEVTRRDASTTLYVRRGQRWITPD